MIRSKSLNTAMQLMVKGFGSMLRSLRNIKILFLTSTRTSSGIQTVPRVGEPFVGTLECILQSNLFICQHTTQQKLYYLLRIATSGPPEQLGCSVYSSIHDSIMPSKLKLTSRIAPDTNQVSTLKAACLNSAGPKLSDQIDKNVFHAKSVESKRMSPL